MAQTSVKEIARIALIALAVMLALPAAYRLWLVWHPQPAGQGRSLTRLLEKATEENALRLLRTPLSKWSDYERGAEPKIRDWLAANERTVLPWEWTEEARRKDPEGHRRLWIGIFLRQEAERESRLKGVRKRLRALEREIWIAETIHAHRTNQLAHVQASVAGGSYPMEIRVERLAKGRLWGWNRTTERVRFARQSDFDGPGGGWLANERRILRTESLGQAKSQAERDELRKVAERVSAAIDSIRVLLGRLRDSDRVDCPQCQRALCTLIQSNP